MVAPNPNAAQIKPKRYRFTPEQSKNAALRSVAIKRARRELIQGINQGDTVCRDKLQVLSRILLSKVKPTDIKIKNIKDLATLASVTELAYGWKNNQTSQHLHVHTVSQLRQAETPLHIDNSGGA